MLFCYKRLRSYGTQRTAVWLVADFEALSYQVTTTFDTSCTARIHTASAINYTACYAQGFCQFIHDISVFLSGILCNLIEGKPIVIAA